MEQGTRETIDRWHDMMSASSHDGLFELLAEDCIFWSPVVHTPQRGRDITYLYLSAASQVFGGGFCYESEMIDGSRAVLEFTCTIDDIQINGVDIIQVRDQQISEFKVMVRPLKAVSKVHERMMSMLEDLKASTS
jgi:hypothetical protein